MTSPSERFTAIFERTHRSVLGYVVRRVAEPGDAADVVAETFLVVWRRLDQVPSGDEERAWLFGVARRVLSNHRRGVRRRHAMVERLRADLTRMTPALEPPGALGAALARLSDGDRELLLLLAWDGLGQEEAALSLGISHNTLRVRLHRARTRLRTHLASAEPPSAAAPTTVEGMHHA